jgi:hypothetical protein
VNATIDGVVRMPSALAITTGVVPSMTDTHEFVVPRSIPMILPMRVFLNKCDESSLVSRKRLGKACQDGMLPPNLPFCQNGGTQSVDFTRFPCGIDMICLQDATNHKEMNNEDTILEGGEHRQFDCPSSSIGLF